MKISARKGKFRVSGKEEKKKKKKKRRGNIVWKLLFIHRRVGILMKFPKYPFNKIQDITFFPPYKNSSSNFITRKEIANQWKR